MHRPRAGPLTPTAPANTAQPDSPARGRAGLGPALGSAGLARGNPGLADHPRRTAAGCAGRIPEGFAASGGGEVVVKHLGLRGHLGAGA